MERFHMNLRLLTAKVILQIRNKGFIQVTKDAVSRLMGTAADGCDTFDIERGTDTSGILGLWRFKIDSPNAKHGVQYGTVSENHIKCLLDPLPRSATFIDLGCGKGRPLIVASEMGFKNVIGVEFVKDLAEIARNNLAKMSLCGTIIYKDVIQYELPNGPIAIYLCNPFDHTVMSAIADKMRRRKRELWVIYINPRYREFFDQWMQEVPLTSTQTRFFGSGSVAIWHRNDYYVSGQETPPCKPV
jgi:SAM-dependent methyltransferase